MSSGTINHPHGSDHNPLYSRTTNDIQASNHKPTAQTADRISPLLTLPPELLPHLTQHLSYPDNLSLRLTHPHFYHSPLLSTDNDAGIRSRIAWLCTLYAGDILSAQKGRFSLAWIWNLPCWLVSPSPFPREGRGAGRCNSGASGSVVVRTDAEFRQSACVQRMLQARVRHSDCPKDGGGCVVVPGGVCSGPRSGSMGRGGCSSAAWGSVVVDAGRRIGGEISLLRKRSLLDGWDLLFIGILVICLCAPWVWLLQGFAAAVGWDVSSQVVSFVVMAGVAVVGRSGLEQSRARKVK